MYQNQIVSFQIPAIATNGKTPAGEERGRGGNRERNLIMI
jgi:hypothetical protein